MVVAFRGILSAGYPICYRIILKDLANRTVELTAIDHSKNQIALFKRVFYKWAQFYPFVKCKFHKDDAIDFLKKNHQKWDLIVLSYLFAELPAFKKLTLMRLLEKKYSEDGTEVIIIDTCPDTDKCEARFLSGSRFQLVVPATKMELSELSILRIWH